MSSGQSMKADLYLRGVRERLRVSGLLDTERDLDFCRGDGLLFTLAWRDGTDRAGVPVLDPAGDFSWDTGNGMDIISRSESEPLLSLAVLLGGDLDFDLSGVKLRFSSDELWRALAEASESTDRERLLPFFSSSEDFERLLLPLALLLRGDADDDDELRDELLDLDFFLFSSDDFSDADELSLCAGDADRRVGEGGDGGSSRGSFCVGGLGT